MNRISRQEWRFVALITLGILLLTALPYVYAALSVPPEKHFMGFILNTSDHAQYLWWYRGFQDALLIPNRQTPEPNPPVFFNLLWFVLARFGKFTGLDYRWVYQIFRFAAGAMLMPIVYWWCAQAFERITRRKTAFLVLALGAGLGWVQIVLKYTLWRGELYYPLGVYLAEGNFFLNLMAYPHFAEAAAFILLTLGLLWKGEKTENLRYAWAAALSAFLLGWQHTYDLILVWGIPGLYALARWAQTRRFPWYWFKALLIVGLISFPPALYSVLLTTLNPIWKEVLAQFDNAGVFTPNPLRMFIPMGIPLFLGLAGALTTLRAAARPQKAAAPHKSRLRTFLLAWFFGGWALTYVPTDFQIHMINSWQVPVVLLGVDFWFEKVHPRLAQRWQALASPALAAAVLLAAVIPTNGYIFLWRFLDLHRYNYPYFLHQAEYDAMQWLDENAPSDAIVLSSYEPGRYIPAISGRTAFLSHWAQTVDFYTKRDFVAAFFQADTPDAQRRQVITQFGVDYVLYGPAERALGTYDPAQSPWLHMAFEEDGVRVYAVGK
ncbi:MAG TPA: hypothetical protein ENJ02_06340 [Chloroflexi bacterium]|nr:hypothetical protein [Chloroflexota bacterium]